MTSIIYLIRHGLTEGLQKHWFYGWADLPVVKEGFEEIEKYKKEGVYPKLPEDTDFYTSGMLRPKQTLEAIYGNVDFKIIEELKEINFGDWECKPMDGLKDDKEWHRWMADETGEFTFPGGGESAIIFGERVKKGLKVLQNNHRMKELSHRHSGKDAVSVCVMHGGPISVIMGLWFPGTVDYFFQWNPDPGRGYAIYFEDGNPVKYEEI